MPAGDRIEEATLEPDSRFLLEEVPWQVYVDLRDAPANGGTRMTYLEGRLELTSPSEAHEERRALLRRLINAWAEQHDVDLRGFGSTTYRREAERRGLEPDECYVLGPGLGVQEVWVWHSTTRRMVVHRLSDRRYEQHEGSALLPDLDLALLTSFVRPGESHTARVKEYRAALRRGAH